MSARIAAGCAWWLDVTYDLLGHPRTITPRCECSWAGTRLDVPWGATKADRDRARSAACLVAVRHVNPRVDRP